MTAVDTPMPETATAPAAEPWRQRLIRTLLFNVEPMDPLIYAGVALLFGCVGCLACLIPSLRAARIDPVVALRPA